MSCLLALAQSAGRATRLDKGGGGGAYPGLKGELSEAIRFPMVRSRLANFQVMILAICGRPSRSPLKSVRGGGGASKGPLKEHWSSSTWRAVQNNGATRSRSLQWRRATSAIERAWIGGCGLGSGVSVARCRDSDSGVAEGSGDSIILTLHLGEALCLVVGDGGRRLRLAVPREWLDALS